uniref:Lysosomal acid phosphatase n=1 Tax=Neogobius melanostomus TaxID=47308 RepID=A0A8C6T5U3_9GOBI
FLCGLFRHGDRSPIRAYPTDPYQESAWPQGFGQLSQVGMQQHYNLGQFLRKRYTGFLNESYDRHEISVRSTDYDRTLMSAEANLAGLYPPSGSQVFNPNVKWQPVPVHTVPMAEERSQHNLTAPDWVTPEVMSKLKYLKDFGFRTLFGVYKPIEKSRLQGGMLLGEIVKNLTAMASEHSRPRLKLMMLSAHDTTVTALQASLKVFNGIQPPYASCHIIELYKDNGSFSVSMFYRNDTELYQLQLPGCALDCPLEDFKALTKPSISDDRDAECQLSSHGTNKEVIISLAVSGCLLFLLVAMLLAVICRQTDPMRTRGYEHVINGDES